MNMFKLRYDTVFQLETTLTIPVKTALDNLRRDIRNTLSPAGTGSPGTIRLLADTSLAPEAYAIAVDEGTITVKAADDLGFIFALYYISEHYLGVHPLWFWNDQAFRREDFRAVPAGVVESASCRVAYRGWFLNDHQLLDGWTDVYEDEEFVWNRIYETVLRLGGNLMIPSSLRDQQRATDQAVQNGLYITHTHNMPLGAETFGLVWPDLQASYDLYPDKFQQLWREAVQRQKHLKIIWNLGYRGNGDAPFWEHDPAYDTPEKRGALIAGIIQKQMEIVRESVKNPVFCTNLYGEMTELYRTGCLPLPEGVIKIWGDNGYGRMVSRRQDDVNPRTDAMPKKGSGKNGAYYHAAFHDLQASNHLAMSPNSAAFIAQELESLFENDGADLLVVNSGSVKPHLYILDLIAKLWREGRVNVQEHATQYAGLYYGEQSAKIARLLTSFDALTPQYGSHRDERGGEQLYHYTARYLIQSFLAGRTGQPAGFLKWLTGSVPLIRQTELVRTICENAIALSDRYKKECEDVRDLLAGRERRLFDDTLWLQTVIHNSGLHGLYNVCKAIEEKNSGNGARAFVHAQDAYIEYIRGLTAMRSAEHDQWKGFYRNDCLTNISTTCYTVHGLRMWLRIVDEGEYFTAWEQDYLMDPHDRRIVCCFNTDREKTDAELARGMKLEYDRLHQGSRFSRLSNRREQFADKRG